MTEIFRERKESERNLNEGGFKDIRTWKKSDVMQLSLKEMAKVEHECTSKQRLPYCSKCAINAIEKKIQEVNQKIKKSAGKDEDVKIDFDIDYNKFAGEALFERGDDTEIEEDKLLDGIRQRVVTGKYKNYVCKTCGNNLSMEFKSRELETTKTQIDPKTLK